MDCVGVSSVDEPDIITVDDVNSLWRLDLSGIDVVDRSVLVVKSFI